MPQVLLAPFKVRFIVSSASAVATLAAIRIVERLVRAESHALDIAATLGGMVVAAGLVYVVARVVLPPAAWAPTTPRPLSRVGRLELVTGFVALLAIAFVARIWLRLDGMLTIPLLYVPSAFFWLRRELARN